MSKCVGVHPHGSGRQVRSSRRRERSARRGPDRFEARPGEAPDVDADIDLTGQRCQTAMAVAMEVESTTCHRSRNARDNGRGRCGAPDSISG